MPQTSSLSKRKTVNSIQFKTTAPSTDGPGKTITFPHSFPKLSTASPVAPSSLNSTYAGNITMSTFKKETNGKWHSSLLRGSSSQQLCSSDSPTPQPPSK